MSWRAMGRRSLEATKLLCSLMVRAAVDFFLVTWPFFAGAFLLLEEEGGEAFFLLDVELPLFFADWFVVVEASCAGNPAPCSNRSAVRRAEVNRVGNIVTLSLTRFVGWLREWFRCPMRYRRLPIQPSSVRVLQGAVLRELDPGLRAHCRKFEATHAPLRISPVLLCIMFSSRSLLSR